MLNRYYFANSMIHKMHPLAKIICMLIFLITSILNNSLKIDILMIMLLTIILFSTNVPIKIYLKTVLKWLLAFLIIGLILKINIMILIVLRIIYFVLWISILTLTTPIGELIYGIEKLLLPLKIIGVPTKKIALYISTIMKTIPVTRRQSNKIAKSQASRGVKYKKSILKQKLDEQFLAMELRLYDINKKRVNFRQSKWKLYDTFLVLIHLSILLLVVKEVYL